MKLPQPCPKCKAPIMNYSMACAACGCRPADGYLTVPRALLELCEVLLHEQGVSRLPTEMHSDYDLTLAQLRAFLSLAT